MGIFDKLFGSSKETEDNSLVQSPGTDQSAGLASLSLLDQSLNAGSQTVQATVGKRQEEVMGRMSEDQKSVFENYSDEEKQSYREKTSRMSDEDVDKFNILNLTNFDTLLGSVMTGGKEHAKKQAEAQANEVSLKLFGYYGGTFMRLKSSSVGYELRVLIKNKAREWAREQVDEEYNKRVAALPDTEDKAIKTEELDMRKMYLKAHLYSEIKENLMAKIETEAKNLSTDTRNAFASQLEQGVKAESVDKFKVFFNARMKSNKKLPSDEKIETSRREAIEDTFKSKEAIGDTAFSGIKSEVMAYTNTKGHERLADVITTMGGTMDGKKADLSNISGDSAVDYLYGGEAEDSNFASAMEEKRNSITEKMSNNEIVSPDLNKGLTKYSMFVMNTVPIDGDTAEASATIKIPVYEGVTLNFSVGGESEREKKYVSSKVNIGIGASGDVGIANLTGEIGGFIETKAATPENMGSLISYVMYRKARESSIMPTDLTNAIWGMGNKTGEGRFKEAETFGAMAEKRLFGAGADDENMAMHGGYGKLSAEIGDMDKGLGGEIEVEGSVGREYSKASFEEGHAGAGRLGCVGEYRRFGQKSKGDLMESVSFEAAIGGLGLKGTAGAELKFRGTSFEEFAISGSGEFMVPVDFTGGAAVGIISTAIGDVLSNFKKIKGASDRVLRNRNIPPSEANYDNDFQQNVEKAQVGTEKVAQYLVTGVQGFTGGVLGAQSGIRLTFEYSKSAGEAGDLSISLDNVQTLGLDLEVFEFEVEKTHRIAKWSTGEGWE